MRNFICFICLTLFLFSLSSSAQTSEPKKEIVFEELNLTDAQIDALTTARETVAEEMKAKKELLNKNSDEIMLLAAEQQKKMMAKMEEIFTHEQLESHKKNIALLKQQQETHKKK